MLRIALVGDLSLQPPWRLENAMRQAGLTSDFIVQLGDMHPGYSVVKPYMDSGKALAIPGNHDINWDQELAKYPRNWTKDFPDANFGIIGLDNSQDKLDWGAITPMLAVIDASKTKRYIVCIHKPLSTIVLSDGSESTHNMGEGQPNADSDQLKAVLAKRENVQLICCGHYHGWTLMKTPYGDTLVEGRGGAAPQIGYTMLFVQPEGIAIHQMDL